MAEPATNYAQTWLVIPLYNEAEVISDVVKNAKKSFANIVCVDDGSTDDSVREARRAGAIVVQHPFNLGQGAALQTGIDFALRQPNMQYLLTFDADGQHRVEDATAMVDQAIAQDLAMVFGTRFRDGASPVGWSKKAVLKTAAAVTRWKTGLDLTDAHNGLRLLRRDAAERIDLKQNRMAHASEIVGQLAATDLPWAERPVTIDYTEYSKAKGQSLLNSVNILVDLVMR
ncbi:glycosyltransferase family 2 protein [Actinomycetaceae bacterium MB13-C1-2]|nr:glycosyltransferase family 2 protein [Actinomycetaceae bacterium MB13-C1-2]